MRDPGEADLPRSRDYVQAAYAKVGEPGTSNRWHDRVYRICNGILRLRFGRRSPRWLRDRISLISNYALVYHQHEINKAWSPDDPLNNFAVPDDEHVEIPSIWIIELFPPSEYHSLVSAIERNEWDRQRIWYGVGDPANREALERSRTGAGYAWWRLGTIADPSEHSLFPESVRRELPAQFSSVELRALQIGTGLTAVAATFAVRAKASAELDQVWHEAHEPRIHHAKGRRPVAEGRQFAAYRRTQEARRGLHEAARQWLSSNCPGFFSVNGELAPLLDLLLVERYDPTSAKAVRDYMSEPMRALGLTDYEIEHQTSDALPGLLLERVREQLVPGLDGRRTWTLFGQRDVVLNQFGQRLAGTGGGSRGLSYEIGETIFDFLILLGGDCFVDVARSQLAASRDRARDANKRFRTRTLKALRAEVLQLSLDLSTVQRDFVTFYRRDRWEYGHLGFVSQLSPAVRAGDKSHGLAEREPIPLSERMIDMQLEQLQSLVEVDRSHREIVSSAASIGAAISASRLGRVAAAVAFATLIVAVSTLLVTSFDPNAPLVKLWHRIGL